MALGIIAFLIAYSAGAAVHMGKQQTADLRQHFAEQIRGIDQNGIFINKKRYIHLSTCKEKAMERICYANPY